MSAEVDRVKGGWGWLLLPLLVMLVGSNSVFGLFMATSGDLATASRQTNAIGPVTWSVLQLLLLVFAVRQLRKSGASLGQLVGAGVRPRKDALLGLGVAVVASVVILLLLGLQSSFGDSAGPPWPRSVLIYWTLVTSVTAGVGEEIYFRGFLFHRLGRLGRLPLLLVTSLSFSLWHVAPNMLLHTFALGLLFGGVYAVTGRLFPVIVAHVGTDVIGGSGMLLGYW